MVQVYPKTSGNPGDTRWLHNDKARYNANLSIKEVLDTFKIPTIISRSRWGRVKTASCSFDLICWSKISQQTPQSKIGVGNNLYLDWGRLVVFGCHTWALYAPRDRLCHCIAERMTATLVCAALIMALYPRGTSGATTCLKGSLSIQIGVASIALPPTRSFSPNTN